MRRSWDGSQITEYSEDHLIEDEVFVTKYELEIDERKITAKENK